jgi:hypothetical protein
LGDLEQCQKETLRDFELCWENFEIWFSMMRRDLGDNIGLGKIPWGALNSVETMLRRH